jgi:hypothetical protein
VEYTSWYIGADGVFILVGHSQWTSVCDSSGGGGWGDSGSGNSGGGGGGGVTQGRSGDDVYWDPLVHSGGGTSVGWVYPTSSLYNFNLHNAIHNTTTHDRLNMDVNLRRTINALGLASSLTGWSLVYRFIKKYTNFIRPSPFSPI